MAGPARPLDPHRTRRNLGRVTWARRWWRRHSGVRARSALAAALVVAAAAVVSAAALVLLLRHSLTESLDRDAVAASSRVADRLGADGHSDRDARLAVGSGGAGLIQVLDASGRVIAASPQLADADPLSAARPTPGHTVITTEPWDDTDDGDDVDLASVTGTENRSSLAADEDDEDKDQEPQHWVRVAARGVDTVSGHMVVLVAVSLDPVERTSHAVLRLVLLGGPVLVLITGSATYAFAGRALRPVEAIRRRVAGLTSRDLATRVEVPPARDELRRLAETMNDMLARLEAAQQTQRRFVADASHELRSPLATLIAGLELGHRSGGLDHAEWETLRAEADRLAVLVDDLLLLARADERGLLAGVDDVDLDDVVDAEASRLRGLGGREVTVVSQPARVRGHRAQLERVVRNLADNAARHARSRVTLEVRTEATAVVIEVSDDGPGVAPEDRRRIFERFVRLDASRERGAGGVGLGLAIVAEVVAAHAGTVEMDEAPGGGARVRVRLPVPGNGPEPDGQVRARSSTTR